MASVVCGSPHASSRICDRCPADHARRSARAPEASQVARGDHQRLDLGRRPGLSPPARRVLTDHLRLARPGTRPQSLAAVPRRRRRRGDPFHSRPWPERARAAADSDARLRRLIRPLSEDHSAAHRSGGARRRLGYDDQPYWDFVNSGAMTWKRSPIDSWKTSVRSFAL